MLPLATLRYGAAKATGGPPEGTPPPPTSDPAPPEIGRGSKRALTHRAGKSNRLIPHVRQGRSPRTLGNYPPSPGEVSSGPWPSGRSIPSGPEALQSPPNYYLCTSYCTCSSLPRQAFVHPSGSASFAFGFSPLCDLCASRFEPLPGPATSLPYSHIGASPSIFGVLVSMVRGAVSTVPVFIPQGGAPRLAVHWWRRC